VGRGCLLKANETIIAEDLEYTATESFGTTILATRW